VQRVRKLFLEKSMNMLYALLGWIAVALTICAGFLYLICTEPDEQDEEAESGDYNWIKSDSMRGTL